MYPGIKQAIGHPVMWDLQVNTPANGEQEERASSRKKKNPS
jgi:hypothetical protein